jgi:hypothetical protein
MACARPWNRSGAADGRRRCGGRARGDSARAHWRSRGYDCSGAVSFILHAAGLLDYPLDSTGFMHWGRAGNNRWVRIYANHEHVFAIVDGLRWDTSYITDGDRSGPGWSEAMRPEGGFHLRHPAGAGAWRATA